MITVWDRLVRALHWTSVASVATAWLSTLHLGISQAHEGAGYVAAAAVVTRLLWGGLGSAYARFGQFVQGPAAVWRYAQLLRRHREPRYLGHNPLGGWMILALLACVGAVAVSGWLQTTDRYWGSECLEVVHTSLAWGLLVLIALHVAGVVFTSWRHHDHLVRAMITGRKAAPREGDVT